MAEKRSVEKRTPSAKGPHRPKSPRLPKPTPAAPSGLSASEVSSNEIDLSWSDNSGGAAGFIVDRSDDGGSTFYDIATLAPSTTTYQDTSVSDGVTEVYEVAAYNTDAPAAQSTFSGTATAATPLAAPDNFDAEAASTSEIDLSWIDESQVAQSDTILRADVGSYGAVGTYSAIATIAAGSLASYSDTGLPSGSTYSYEIQTNQTVGTSVTTADSTAVTATTDLAAPTGVTIQYPQQTSLGLTWSTVTGATGYAIERTGGPDGSNWAIIGGTGAGWATGYQDTSVVPGQLYTYDVVAYDDSDRSDPSSTASVTTPLFAPSYVGIAATPINNTSIFLNWSGTNIDSTTTWTLETSTDDINWTPISTMTTAMTASASNFTVTGLAPVHQYYYEVIASNSAGTSTAYTGSVITPNFQEPWYGDQSGVTLNYLSGTGISAAGTIPQPGYLAVTRNGGDLDQQITVPVAITGDGVYGTDYTLAEPPGALAGGDAYLNTITDTDAGVTTAYLTFQKGETSAIIEEAEKVTSIFDWKRKS